MEPPNVLENLCAELPLGERWAPPEPLADRITIGGDRIGRAALLTRDDLGRTATGSAAEVGLPPMARAYFELLERTSTMQAHGTPDARWPSADAEGRSAGVVPSEEVFPESDEPNRWQYARSNGIALHRERSQACRRATWELVERDRILRSWYGVIAPQRTDPPPELPATSLYDWRAYVIPDPDPTAWSAEVRVAVVVGFPRRAGLPLAHGFGARDRSAGALGAAAAEAVQRLAFLWEEALPEALPAEVPPTPELHLDWYLLPAHHGRVRSWLEGRHGRYIPIWGHATGPQSPPLYVDLTPPFLRGRAWVVKALCPDALPLTFGPGPERLSGHLPEGLRIHPIA